MEVLSPTLAYGLLFGVLMLCGLGFPIPEDIPLIAGGYVAYTGLFNVHVACALSFTAVIAGDSAAFFMGRQFGRRILATRLARRYFTPRKQRRVRAYFRKYGSKVVFVARFLPGLRFSIFFSAGTLHLKPAVFIVYDGLAAIISVPLLVYAAWWFGDYIEGVVHYARRTEHGILVLVVLGALVVLAKAWRARRKKTPVADPAPSSEPPFPV